MYCSQCRYIVFNYACQKSLFYFKFENSSKRNRRSLKTAHTNFRAPFRVIGTSRRWIRFTIIVVYNPRDRRISLSRSIVRSECYNNIIYYKLFLPGYADRRECVIPTHCRRGEQWEKNSKITNTAARGKKRGQEKRSEKRSFSFRNGDGRPLPFARGV